MKIVGFRDHALRVNNNKALVSAVENCIADSSLLVPIFLWGTSTCGSASASEKLSPPSPLPIDERTGGTAKDVFVTNALKDLNATLHGSLSIGMVLEDSASVAKELINLCKQSDANEIYYLKSFDEKLEQDIEKRLLENDISPKYFVNAFTLIDYSIHNVPWMDIILEHPFRSPLIPFVDYVLRQLDANPPGALVEMPSELPTVLSKSDELDGSVLSIPIDIEHLLQKVGTTKGGTKWGDSILSEWPASESDGSKALASFFESLETKKDGEKSTHLASRLSPYLARGIISPQQVYHGLQDVGKDTDVDSFVRRICWRDYTYAAVSLYPDVVSGKAIRHGYEDVDGGIVGSEEERLKRLDAWKWGRTGFPLVDSGMRQLRSEGWMPQKVRLAVSTCLVEGLGLSWREGMDHFAEFLVDYDIAINSNMWENAGCVGLDPYYVGMNYKRRSYWDKDGSYVRRWCPELKMLPDEVDVLSKNGPIKRDCLYEPWAAPIEVLENVGVNIGADYPLRICNDRESRSEFFTKVREFRSQWSSSLIDDRKRDMVSIGRTPEAEKIGLFTPRAFQLKRSR